MNGVTFQPETKMAKWILNCIFPVVKRCIYTKNGYGDLEVYMEYGYVFVSTTGRNHDKMAYCLFKHCLEKLITIYVHVRSPRLNPVEANGMITAAVRLCQTEISSFLVNEIGFCILTAVCKLIQSISEPPVR